MDITEPSDLFGQAADVALEGFRYADDIVSPEEQRALVRDLEKLPFREFEFQGFLGKRRVVSFGWRYDFNGGGFQKIDPIPDFLRPLRDQAARFAGVDPAAIEHALI